MIVQGAAYHPTAGALAASGYSLGVRVYRANSFAADITLKPPIKSDSLVTNALGDRKLPLAQMTTEVPPTGTSSFNDLRDRLQPSPSPSP
jgi:hypothetical protein